MAALIILFRHQGKKKIWWQRFQEIRLLKQVIGDPPNCEFLDDAYYKMASDMVQFMKTYCKKLEVTLNTNSPGETVIKYKRQYQSESDPAREK